MKLLIAEDNLMLPEELVIPSGHVGYAPDMAVTATATGRHTQIPKESLPPRHG